MIVFAVYEREVRKKRCIRNDFKTSFYSFILLGCSRPCSQHHSELPPRQIFFNILPLWALRCCPGNSYAVYGFDYDFPPPSPNSQDFNVAITWSRLARQQHSFSLLLSSSYKLCGFSKFLKITFLRPSISYQI